MRPGCTAQKASYLLHLADNALVLGHRNSEWTGHGPILEQDIALSNISLDLIGQARNLYHYASRLINASPGIREILMPGSLAPGEVTEDTLAYLRDSWDYKNCLLVEQPNGDWGKTVLRQFFFSAYQFCLYGQLEQSNDTELAAIAEKSIKEVSYHLRWSSEWVIRLGYGTTESHRRMDRAMEELWPFTGELFIMSPYEKEMSLAGEGADLAKCASAWNDRIREVLTAAGLLRDCVETADDFPLHRGGKEGQHTEHLGYILAEMQFLQRAYPDCEW